MHTHSSLAVCAAISVPRKTQHQRHAVPERLTRRQQVAVTPLARTRRLGVLLGNSSLSPCAPSGASDCLASMASGNAPKSARADGVSSDIMPDQPANEGRQAAVRRACRRRLRSERAGTCSAEGARAAAPPSRLPAHCLRLPACLAACAAALLRCRPRLERHNAPQHGLHDTHVTAHEVPILSKTSQPAAWCRARCSFVIDNAGERERERRTLSRAPRSRRRDWCWCWRRREHFFSSSSFFYFFFLGEST